jgi:NAD(P)-dependent dehydrogenase (short-subunit alcohol dehydrogenase family)
MVDIGIFLPPFSLTGDGFESQWQTNHLSHFLLTLLLKPHFVHGTRVVNVAAACMSTFLFFPSLSLVNDMSYSNSRLFH